MHLPGSRRASYSHFAIGQTILALPFIAFADAFERAIGPNACAQRSGATTRLPRYARAPRSSSPAPMRRSPRACCSPCSSCSSSVSARAGAPRCSPRAAGASTYVATHAVYFLQHTSEAIAILAGFAALYAWRRTGRVVWLAAGVLSSACVLLVRVPAAVAGPALAGYLAWTLVTRARESRLPSARVAVAIALPSAAVAAVYVAINFAKWGTWLTSPMTAQSFLLHGSLWTGIVGLLFSPGAGLFVYSPLLILLPLWWPGFWRAHRAEALTALALAASFLFLCGRFVFWHGLWSAPGPRYLFALVPLLLLPLGPWLDTARPRWQRGATAALALLEARSARAALRALAQDGRADGVSASSPESALPVRPAARADRATCARSSRARSTCAGGPLDRRARAPAIALAIALRRVGARARHCARRLRASLATSAEPAASSTAKSGSGG
jgi:hypothetical protein